jgi:hypothetical protein
MNRYLNETPHTEQNCRELVGWSTRPDISIISDWGCMGGVHCGWAIIEAENESQVGHAVLPLVRSEARVVKIVKFARSMLNSRHPQ